MKVRFIESTSEDEYITCRYCGQKVHGAGCISPNGYHVSVGDSEHCIYCGSSNYGVMCSYNVDAPVEKRYHVHGHGEGKCVYCGQKATGMMCPYSPDGYHKM